MIAPRKKKLIKLIIMAWSVVLVITGSALPVFAESPATDDQGNFSPSYYWCHWRIYNPDTLSYDLVDVTSSVTSSGLTFTFPYNSYGVSQVIMYLLTPYRDSQENYYISGLSFDGYLSYSRSSSLISLTSDSRVYRTYYDGSSQQSVYSTFGTSNPFSYSESYDTLLPFNVLRFQFYISAVSGSLTVHFNSLVVGGSDIKDKIYISQLEDSTEDLDSGVEALETALPLPTFDASAFASAEAIADDYTFFNDGLRFSFMESDLVTHIFILVVYFTCLSIAIFGHAGG